MDPNQLPQQPISPNPQPAPPQPQVVSPIQPEIQPINQTTQPVYQQQSSTQPQQAAEQPIAASQQPIQPTFAQQPQPVVAAPVVNGMPSQPIQPIQPGVIGQAPVQPGFQPVAPMGSAPAGGLKGKFAGARQKIGIAFSIIAVIAAVGIWAINNGIFSKGTALETYEGEGYSILVPADYEKDTADSKDVTFTQSGVGDEEASVMNVAVESNVGDDMDEYKQNFKDTMNESYLQGLIGSDGTLKDYKSDDKKISGHEAIVISANIENKTATATEKGAVSYVVVFAEDDIYIITIFANGNAHGLTKQFDKITDSFTTKG